MKVDYIIVGQGLAGTLLAYELYLKNKSFLVYNDPTKPAASTVAAGLINPIVFRRMTKSWLVDDAFPQMESTYLQLENLLNEKLYFPARMFKIPGEESVGFWKEKAIANKLEPYVEIEPNRFLRNKLINDSCDLGCVNKSGRLDIRKLISTFQEFLNRKNLIRMEAFNFKELILKKNQVIYQDVTAEKIIFCEGPAVSQNPYFENLRFKHSKGEILELHIPDLKLNEIISQEVFLMPIGDDRYKVGATYSWNELNMQTTDLAREELLGKLKKFIAAKYEIIGQQAGIRPTMHDRKPVIGFLPDNPQIGIFNGLGSKGVLLGPYFAKQFVEYLCGNSVYIYPEANINRYFRKK